jgi:hypothetical protein
MHRAHSFCAGRDIRKMKVTQEGRTGAFELFRTEPAQEEIILLVIELLDVRDLHDVGKIKSQYYSLYRSQKQDAKNQYACHPVMVTIARGLEIEFQ